MYTHATAQLLHQLQVHVTDVYDMCHGPGRQELVHVPNHDNLCLITGGEEQSGRDGHARRPAPGQLCLLPAAAQVDRSLAALTGKGFCRIQGCHFSARVGELGLFQWLDVPHRLTIPHPGKIAELLQALSATLANSSVSARVREKALLLEIISIYLEEASIVRVAASGPDDLERLAEIERFLDAHLMAPLTLNQLACHLHLHPNYLVRYFQKHFAMSPLKYFTRKRMDKACFMLATTSLPVGRVAELVGYGDTNHFAKTFRRETGFSPTAYRNDRRMASAQADHNEECRRGDGIMV